MSSLRVEVMMLLELAERCEKAAGPDRNTETWPEYPLEADIFEAVGGPEWDRLYREGALPCGAPPGVCREYARQRAPHYTASLDAAMTLVPSTTANFDLFSFIGEHKPTWGCRFHDTAQLMGKRAAKEEIARMQKDGAFGSLLRGAPRIVMEKAIAEHFIEFMCMGAVTPALAVCAAALKARNVVRPLGE